MLHNSGSRDYPIVVPATPTLPDANLRYEGALDWRKWTKGGCSFLLCPRSFDQAVMVAQWYDLRLEPRETRVRILPWVSSGHVNTRSPQHLRSQILTVEPSLPRNSWLAQMDKRRMQLPSLSAQFWSSCRVDSESCPTLFPSFCTLPSEVAVLFESEQTPFSLTDHEFKSVALHRILFWTCYFVAMPYLLRDQRMVERLNEVMSTAWSVTSSRQFHRKFHFTWNLKKNLLFWPSQNLHTIKNLKPKWLLN